MQKTRLNKYSKLPIAKLKKEADKIFSLWVRNRGSQNYYNQCYTCFRRFPLKQLQCGHFVARHHSATRYDEMNCKPQCVGCNVFGRGQASKFAEHLIEEYGMEEFQKLLARGNSIFKLSTAYLESIIAKYKGIC